MKRLLVMLLSLLLLFPVSGCLEARALDRFGYVQGIGFDPGEKLPYKVTLMLQNTELKEDGQRNSGFTLVNAECRSLFEGIETLSANLPYQLDLSRTMLVVVNAKLAAKPGEMENLFDIAVSSLRIRDNASLFISLSDGEEAMKGLENELEPNISRMEENFTAYAKETGLIPIINIAGFKEASKGQVYDAIAPLCGKSSGDDKELPKLNSPEKETYPYIGGSLLVKGGMKTGLAGCAVFSGGRMTGILDGQDTQLLLMMRDEFVSGRLRMEGPNGEEISVRLYRSKPPETALSLPDMRAVCVLHLLAELEQPSELKDMEKSRLENMIAENLEKRAATLFSRCLEMQADAPGFGRKAIMEFATGDSWDAYRWKTRFPKLRAAFVFRVTLPTDPRKTVLE